MASTPPKKTTRAKKTGAGKKIAAGKKKIAGAAKKIAAAARRPVAAAAGKKVGGKAAGKSGPAPLPSARDLVDFLVSKTSKRLTAAKKAVKRAAGDLRTAGLRKVRKKTT